MSAGFFLRCALIILGLSAFGCSAPVEPKEERVLRSIQRGRASIRMGRYWDAIGSFQEAVALDPEAMEAHLELDYLSRKELDIFTAEAQRFSLAFLCVSAPPR